MIDGLNVFYFEWEHALLMWFQSIHCPALDFIFPKISFLGNSGWLAILTTVLLLIFAKKDRRLGWQAFLGLLLAFLVCNVILKNVFDRARPCDIWPEIELLVKRPHDSSFPSGHTNASFATAMVIFTRNKKWGIPALVLAALIAISRMYLFMHFPTDVLAGMINGILWAVISYFVINWFFKKYKKPVDTL